MADLRPYLPHGWRPDETKYDQPAANAPAPAAGPAEPADLAPTDWAARGVQLVAMPLGRKGPQADGWHQRAADPTRINGQNFGIIHGLSGTCAIDIDDRELSVQILEAYGLDLDEMIAGTFAWAGRPGRVKLLYRAPEGLELPIRKLEVGKGEVLGFRGAGDGTKAAQDVLPPSIHPDTHEPYTCITLPRPVADLPYPPQPLLDIWTDWDEHRPTLLALLSAPVPEAQKTREQPPSDSAKALVAAFNLAHDVGESPERNDYKRCPEQHKPVYGWCGTRRCSGLEHIRCEQRRHGFAKIRRGSREDRWEKGPAGAVPPGGCQ